MMRRANSIHILLIYILIAITFNSCMSAYVKSVGGDNDKIHRKIYIADFDTTWLSVVDVLKSQPMDISNREAGYIRTKWVENTAKRNFVESFGNSNLFLKAQFRLEITLTRGYYNGRPSVKVTVQKQQLIQNDVLEGWRSAPSSGIEEKTFLYRIGRIIYIRRKVGFIEEQKTREAIEEFSL